MMEIIQEINHLAYLEKCYEADTLNPENIVALKDPFMLARNFSIAKEKPIQWCLKRAVDIAGSLIGIAVIWPILLIIALIIKFESKGGIIFKQKRLGLYGKEFYMYKFRSMKENAEDELVQLQEYNETNSGMFKMTNDPRVTRFGKFIRKYSLDELPQLFNVIKGEMSLVGFRPPIKRELKSYKSWHYVRFASLPGLTGPWQVNGRSKIKDFDEVVKLEYDYVNYWSYLADLKILIKTIPVVLFGKDAS